MIPVAISTQNSRCFSRRCEGAPGDLIGDRPVNSAIHPAGLPIYNLHLEVLRRSIESTQYTAIQFSNWLDDHQIKASYGSVGDCFDNAAMESSWATLKRDLRHIHGGWEHLTRSELRAILFDYIEVFYNWARHQAGLDHQTPAETYAASKAA